MSCSLWEQSQNRSQREFSFVLFFLILFLEFQRNKKEVWALIKNTALKLFQQINVA